MEFGAWRSLEGLLKAVSYAVEVLSAQLWSID